MVDDDSAATQEQMIIYALVGLVSLSLLSSAAWFAFSFGGGDGDSEDHMANWVDPVIEIEDENHSHTDLMAHRLKTD